MPRSLRRRVSKPSVEQGRLARLRRRRRLNTDTTALWYINNGFPKPYPCGAFEPLTWVHTAYTTTTFGSWPATFELSHFSPYDKCRYECACCTTDATHRARLAPPDWTALPLAKFTLERVPVDRRQQ